MAPTAQLGALYCTKDDVDALLSISGEQLRLTDEGEAVPTVPEAAYLAANGINYATSRVNFYCQGRYDSDQLAQSWLVNEWATIIATRWLCSRRGNPVPESIEAMYKSTIEDLQNVQAGVLFIPDIGQRNPSGPTWSNVIVRPEYEFRKIRVERPLSGEPPSSYPQKIDYASQNSYEI